MAENRKKCLLEKTNPELQKATEKQDANNCEGRQFEIRMPYDSHNLYTLYNPEIIQNSCKNLILATQDDYVQRLEMLMKIRIGFPAVNPLEQCRMLRMK